MPRIALGQLDLTVGDLAGNVARMADAAQRATEAGADLVCFPELAITGYPPEDLVLRREFVDDNLEALRSLASKAATSCPVVVGFVDRSDAGIHNAAALLERGDIRARYHKIELPNFGVFDERRYFTPGTDAVRVSVRDTELGITVCEDAWHDGLPFARLAGVPLIVNINGSPYHRGKNHDRETILRDRARQTGAWIAYVNAVGGQDELVFDGGSMMVAPDGSVKHRATMFTEDLLIVDIHGDISFADDRPAWPEGAEEVYRALVVGLRDYVRKNGFSDVVLGLSGGIDSAMVATLAADALGPEAVRALAMPSPYSSPESLEDAVDCATRLGIRIDTVPIGAAFDAYRHALAEVFAGTEEGVAEENLQARVRGNLLMAISNKFGSIVLATGNKSRVRGGLLDAVRRHGRRVRAHQGRAEDPRLRARRLAERRGRAGRGHGADPPTHDREASERRAPSGPEGHGLAAAVRGARPRDRGLRRGRHQRRRDGRARHPARPRATGRRTWSTAPSTSAARPPRA